MAEAFEMPFGLKTRVGSRNNVLDGGQHPPMGRGNFLRGEVHPIVKNRDTLQSSVQKKSERIDMPFGLWAQMSPRNHILDGVRITPWEGAILGKGVIIIKYRDFLL